MMEQYGVDADEMVFTLIFLFLGIMILKIEPINTLDSILRMQNIYSWKERYI